MSKRKNHVVQMKKNKKDTKNVVAGGYVSSLCGITQTERAEDYKLARRGAGVFENKKRKKMLKPKHKKSNNYIDSCAYYFLFNFYLKMVL